ncbi:MAG: hypothetical protein KDD51_05040 [Bdellovibrionales bacterium]|nr:hypothetical protein [Bdellovibrionales bacterium]
MHTRSALSISFAIFLLSSPLVGLQGGPNGNTTPASTSGAAAQAAETTGSEETSARVEAAAKAAPSKSMNQLKADPTLNKSAGTFMEKEGAAPVGRLGDSARDMNDQGRILGNDPFNLRQREAYQKAIETARQREYQLADAVRNSGTLSANEIQKIVEVTRKMVDTKVGIEDSRVNGSANDQPNLPPQRLQQTLERAQEVRQFYNADPPAALDAIRNLDEYKLFTDSGEEIPVLVDNNEVGAADVGVVQTAPGLEDKFAAIANGQPATAVIINNNIVSPGLGNPTVAEEATTAQAIAEESTPEAATVGRGPASEEDGALTVEDVLKALLGDEALGEEEAGVDVGYDEGPIEDEYFEEYLGKEIPLVLRPGKLRALQRGLSGKIDKSLPIGTRTGNGFRDGDDLLMIAGEKFPVLKGIFQKARRSPTATQLLFWLSIAISLYFMMKLLYNLTQRPQPNYASSSYFTAARAHQNDGLSEDLEISFTEPQPIHVNRAMAQRFGHIPMVQVDPELGQLQEDGEIQSGSFEVIEHTAHSLTAVTTITQEVTGTLAPWTPQDARLLQPNKIYIKMDPKTDKWYLVRANAEGKIGETLAAIFPGTVVEGEILGAQFTAKRYRLKHNGKWAPTADRVQFVVSVMPKGGGPSWWA